MRIAIVDDDKREREQFMTALHGWDPTRQPECFHNGSTFLTAADQSPPFDIAFLDIYMPGENGVEVAEKLKKISPGTEVVFVTTSTDHALDAFSVQALHYLVKPVTTEGIIEAFRRLSEKQAVKRPMLKLTSGDNHYSVYQDEICYIQSIDHAKEIVLENGRVIRVWQTMEALEEMLGGDFLKINRGTLVNMAQIEQIGTGNCLLRNGTRLEFSHRESITVRSTYENYLFDRLSKRTADKGVTL